MDALALRCEHQARGIVQYGLTGNGTGIFSIHVSCGLNKDGKGIDVITYEVTRRLD